MNHIPLSFGMPRRLKTRLASSLSTAEHGYVIRVDFRDYFHLEPSNKCEFDVLEVRDGAHGYSDLMGRFCGDNFPPIITSKDRYLWLKFISDDTIEYRGFRAVFSYIENKGKC